MPKFVIRDKKFYKTLFSLAIPAAMINLMSFAVTLADSLMLGKLGELAMSSVNLANQLWFMVMIVTFGTISGSLVFTSQYWGIKDIYSMKMIMTIMLYIAAFVSTAATIVALFFPEFFMSLYTKDPDVIKVGAGYLRYVGLSYPAYAITNALVSSLRSAHITRIGIVVYLISLVVNVLGNYIFIFGKFGAPTMGVNGAALATLLARICELITILIYLRFFEKTINLRISDLTISVKSYIPAFIKTSGPVVINETLWGVGTTVISSIIGHISSDFVAANSIANTAWQFVYVAISGLASATSVIIGNAVGSGEEKRVIMNKADTIICIAVIFGIVLSSVLYFIRPIVLSWYDITQSTKNIANELIMAYSVVLLLQSPVLHYIVGIFRGGGDTRFAFFLDVIFLWIMAIPLGLLSGFVLKLSPFWVYLCLRSDEVVKIVVGTWRLLSGKWIRNVTYDHFG